MCIILADRYRTLLQCKLVELSPLQLSAMLCFILKKKKSIVNLEFQYESVVAYLVLVVLFITNGIFLSFLASQNMTNTGIREMIMEIQSYLMQFWYFDVNWSNSYIIPSLEALYLIVSVLPYWPQENMNNHDKAVISHEFHQKQYNSIRNIGIPLDTGEFH